jgi:hypothetical protein
LLWLYGGVGKFLWGGDRVILVLVFYQFLNFFRNLGDRCFGQFVFEGLLGFGGRSHQYFLHVPTDRTVFVRRGAVHFKDVRVFDKVENIEKCDLIGRFGQHRTAAVAELGASQSSFGQFAQEAADDGGIGADAGGEGFRSNRFAIVGGKDGEDVDGDGEAGAGGHGSLEEARG